MARRSLGFGWRPGWPPSRRWWWALGAVTVVVALAYAAAFMLDEPMRRSMEARMNAALKGYHVSIRHLDFHPFGFSLDLEDVVLRQDTVPDPPVAAIPRLSASVEWRQLIRARLVGEIEIVRPSVNLNLSQAREEAKDPTPVERKGWQEALEAIYPLKINLFTITDGTFVYTDAGPFKPLHLRHVNVEASNIRNVKSKERTYPSEVHASAQVFEQGRLQIDGNADFLAEPHVGILADIALSGIELDYFRPLTSRFANVTVKGGVLSAEGRVEYAPSAKSADLRHAEISGVDVEYVHEVKGTAPEKKAARKVEEATAKVSEKPGVLVKIDEFNVTASKLAFVNRATNPPYRLYLSDTSIRARNISSQSAEGLGNIELAGKFMDSGPATLKARFRPAKPTPNVDAQIRITDAAMTKMNDFWKAYGKFDVVAGEFSLFSELSVKDGMMSGYIKPMLKDVDVYDPAQDRKKNVVRKAYEAVVGALSTVLENQPRDEVATRVDVSGRIDSPQVSPLAAAAKLFQNAFIKAILPGFERRSRR
jgi:hypothetical protein